MIDNLPDRRVLTGEVDFTMMYAAHDAFARHLDGMAAALDSETDVSPGTAARWSVFEHQLHVHHTAEDEFLWPRLRSAITDPDEAAVLDAMESEHAQLDPLVERIDGRIPAGIAGDAAADIRELAANLRRHMRHEENDALPLIETRLGVAGWAAFMAHMRATHGLRGAAVYFPWLLDGADDESTRRVLRAVPPPARLLYHRVWLPSYRRTVH